MRKSNYCDYSYEALGNKDYKSAATGFKTCLAGRSQEGKSLVGLVTVLSCQGKYQKAMKLFEKNRDKLVFQSGMRHDFVRTLSRHLIRDFTMIRTIQNGYISSIRLNKAMNNVLFAYISDQTHLYALILLGYWYIVLGKRPKDSDLMLQKCLHLPTLDDDFRWQLLSRMSIREKKLLEDTGIASSFDALPDDITSMEYVNKLILSCLHGGDMKAAQARIADARSKDISLSNETMWTYVHLSVEKKAIDDHAVLLSKVLISNGWVTPETAQVIRHARDQGSRYNIERETEILEFFGI
ncbi:MAG: hypothetical protein R6W96_10170 [Clostridia bacterium]